MPAPEIYNDKTQTKPYNPAKWNANDANQVKAFLEYLDANKAELSALNTLSSTVGGHTTAINENSQAVEELETDKQDTLVSGENIKTVGGTSILGTGDIPFPSPSALPYKVYSALLSYSPSFSSIVLQNTLDGTIEFSNPSNGRIDATITGGTFAIAKTFVLTGGISSYFVSSKRQTNLFVSIFFTYYDNTTTGTPYFNDLPIEIRVYN